MGLSGEASLCYVHQYDKKAGKMKTVGIITTFRQPNFGSVLQAFALQDVIERMGYDVKVIDYKYPNEYHWNAGAKHGRRKVSFRMRLGDVRRKVQLLLHLRRPTKMEKLNHFIKKEMRCTRFYSSRKAILEHPPIFDIYVSGSDQIWNPNTMFGDMSYMFDFASANSRRIAYSSSFSCDSIPQKYLEEYRRNLTQFKAIGVREANGLSLVRSITGWNDAKLVLDPTLLLNREQWHEYALKSSNLSLPPKFILCYILAYTYSPEDKMCEMLTFVQQRYSLPIVALSPKPKGFSGEYIRLEDRQAIGNYEFLQIFEKAEMVITSSFHGTAFALNFGKPLLALENGKSRSDDRISSLLNAVGLSSQLILTNTKLENDTTPYYDVENEQLRLEKLRSDSLAFLQESLKG